MKPAKTAKELIKRYLLLCIGLTIMAFGVAFSIKASLGTSPISSVPYVTGKISGLSVGTTTIIMHCFFILLQILILRKRYEIIQLMQLPVALIFGIVTDLAVYTIRNVTCSSYIQQWLLCIVGIILVAIGISIEVTANVVVVAGEGLVLATCKVLPIKFGNMKVIFDVSLVIIAVTLSFIILGKLEGVREGTIAAALCVGMIAKQINKHMEPVKQYLSK